MPRTPGLQPPGKRPQHVVAGIVPVGIVDALEVVDVEDEHADRLRGRRGARDGGSKMGVEVAAVVEAGQGSVTAISTALDTLVRSRS